MRGWYIDPALVLTSSGLEQMRSFFDGGRLPPPIHYLTGLTFTAAGAGTATFTMPVTDWLLAPQGVVSGSTLCLLVDGPLGSAVQSALPVATPYTTAEMSISFIRPVMPGSGLLTGTGTLVHAGRAAGLAEVRVTDERQRLIAVASTRCLILPRLRATDDQVPEAAAPGVEPEWPTPHPFQRPARGEVLATDVWRDMSGLEILRAHISGALPPPPISQLCGIRPVDASDGETTWAMPASEWLCSPVRGRLYGGATAYLAGTACDGAYESVVRRGTAFAPIDLKVYFLRPVAPDGRDLVAIGKVMHRGRTLAVASSEVLDADGKRVAVAIGSALILPGRAPNLISPGEPP